MPKAAVAPKSAPKKSVPEKLSKEMIAKILKKIDNVSAIKVVPITKIHPDPRNARIHSERNINEIKKSIRDYGQQKAIVVDKTGMILAGNGFYQAAVELGLPKIQIQISNLTGNMARAYAISDNRTGELSAFDQKILAGLIKDLTADEDLMSLLDGEVAGFLAAEQANLLSLLDTDGEMSFNDGDAEDIELMDDAEVEDDNSSVRMVQLFLTNETFKQFNEMVERLNGKFGTANTTDCTFAAMRHAEKTLLGGPVKAKKK